MADFVCEADRRLALAIDGWRRAVSDAFGAIETGERPDPDSRLFGLTFALLGALKAHDPAADTTAVRSVYRSLAAFDGDTSELPAMRAAADEAMMVLQIVEGPIYHRANGQGAVEISRETTTPVAAGNRTGAEVVWPPDDGWHFEPGLFYFRRRRYDLAGQPLKLLKVFVESRHASLAPTDLYRAWPDSAILTPDNLRPHLSGLRKVLRRVATDVQADRATRNDPLPHKDGGWQFLLPRR